MESYQATQNNRYYQQYSPRCCPNFQREIYDRRRDINETINYANNDGKVSIHNLRDCVINICNGKSHSKYNAYNEPHIQNKQAQQKRHRKCFVHRKRKLFSRISSKLSCMHGETDDGTDWQTTSKEHMQETGCCSSAICNGRCIEENGPCQLNESEAETERIKTCSNCHLATSASRMATEIQAEHILNDSHRLLRRWNQNYEIAECESGYQTNTVNLTKNVTKSLTKENKVCNDAMTRQYLDRNSSYHDHQTTLKTQNGVLSELESNQNVSDVRSPSENSCSVFSDGNLTVRGQRSSARNTLSGDNGLFKGCDILDDSGDTFPKPDVLTQDSEEVLSCLKVPEPTFKPEETETKRYAQYTRTYLTSPASDQVLSSGYPCNTDATDTPMPSSRLDSKSFVDSRKQFSSKENDNKPEKNNRPSQITNQTHSNNAATPKISFVDGTYLSSAKEIESHDSERLRNPQTVEKMTKNVLREPQEHNASHVDDKANESDDNLTSKERRLSDSNDDNAVHDSKIHMHCQNNKIWEEMKSENTEEDVNDISESVKRKTPKNVSDNKTSDEPQIKLKEIETRTVIQRQMPDKGIPLGVQNRRHVYSTNMHESFVSRNVISSNSDRLTLRRTKSASDVASCKYRDDLPKDLNTWNNTNKATTRRSREQEMDSGFVSYNKSNTVNERVWSTSLPRGKQIVPKLRDGEDLNDSGIESNQSDRDNEPSHIVSRERKLVSKQMDSNEFRQTITVIPFSYHRSENVIAVCLVGSNNKPTVIKVSNEGILTEQELDLDLKDKINGADKDDRGLPNINYGESIKPRKKRTKTINENGHNCAHHSESDSQDLSLDSSNNTKHNLETPQCQSDSLIKENFSSSIDYDENDYVDIKRSDNFLGIPLYPNENINDNRTTRTSEPHESTRIPLSISTTAPPTKYADDFQKGSRDRGGRNKIVRQKNKKEFRLKRKRKKNSIPHEGLNENVDLTTSSESSIYMTISFKSSINSYIDQGSLTKGRRTEWSWKGVAGLSSCDNDSGIGASKENTSSADGRIQASYLAKSFGEKRKPYRKQERVNANRLRKCAQRFFNRKERRIARAVAREIHVSQHNQQNNGRVGVLESYFDQFNPGHQPTEQERMQYEWIRLASFQNYRGNGNALALARNGFYHDHESGQTSTRCYLCDARFSGWEFLDDIASEHVRQSPNCPFVTRNGNMTQNIAITSRDNNDDLDRNVDSPPHSNDESNTGEPEHLTVANTTVTPSNAGEGEVETVNASEYPYQSESGDITQQPSEDPERSDRSMLALSQVRGQRDRNNSEISASTIRASENNVAAGASSNIGLETNRNEASTQMGSRFQSHGQPEDARAPLIAAGAFAALTISNQTSHQEVPTTSEALQGSSRSQGSSTATHQTTSESAAPSYGAEGGNNPLNTIVFNPKHPDYLNIERRINSFRAWPSHLDQTHRKMAEAGFFFVGVADFTRCFCCGGGLRNWEPGDDPILEHTRWFPQCEYIVRLKGERYVAAVQRRHREHIAAQQQEQIQISQRRDENRAPPNPLETEAAAIMREMGYPDERIREAILAVRRQTGSSTVTAQQVLTWLLDDEDRQIGVRLPTNDDTYTPSSTFHSGTSPTSSISYTGESIVSNNTNMVISTQSTAAPRVSTTNTGTHQIGAGIGNQPIVSGATGTASDPNITKQEGNKINTKRNKTKSGKKRSRLKSDTKAKSGTDTQSLKQENEKLRDMQTCKICMENPVNTTMLPCGHLVSCDGCASRLVKCPICRKKIEGTVKTYMS